MHTMEGFRTQDYIALHVAMLMVPADETVLRVPSDVDVFRLTALRALVILIVGFYEPRWIETFDSATSMSFEHAKRELWN